MTPSDRGSQPKQPRQSSGRLPAHVYRRRRLTLAVLGLVVISLLALGVVGIATVIGNRLSQEPSAEPAPTSASPTTQVPVPDESAASGLCPSSAVTVSARVDSQSYDETTKPKFEMVIGNQHTATCLIEVGTQNQEFRVEQGGDVVWSSKYCAAEDDQNAQASTVFAPGTQKTAQFEWNRIRVDENCNRTGSEFAPGTYDLVVQLGDKESEPARFELADPEEPTPTSSPTPSE